MSFTRSVIIAKITNGPRVQMQTAGSKKKEDWTEVSKEQLAEVKLPASFDKLKEQNSYFYHGENISDYELVQTAVALGKMELPTDEKKCIPDRVAMDAFEVLVRDQAAPKNSWSNTLYSEDGKYTFTKTEKKSGISDEEYRKQIVAQAYKDFEKGTFQNKSDGFNKLMKNYTSEVSPDRKGIITSGLKAVSRNRHNVLKPIDFVATLLEGKVKYQKLPSGNSEYIEFYDKNGEMVATYSNNGWTMYTTNAEAARQTEMCMIYNEAWGNAKRGLPIVGGESVNEENLKSSFDVKA